MSNLRFSEFVCGHLAHYVYRLIDPRDGTTFYVGRGQGNRVFDHAAGKHSAVNLEDIESAKLKTIGDIRNASMEVQHVIHRHGMTEDAAKEVEAALIDAYPGLSNIQPGYDDNRGVMHAVEVITEYEAPLAEPKHRLLLINVSRSLSDHHNLIDAVRFAWKVDPKKASSAEYVLAVRRGLIIGAFVADKWMEATKENFPELYLAREGYGPRQGRYGFNGHEAPKEISGVYCQKRVPERKKGEANPIRYWNMEK